MSNVKPDGPYVYQPFGMKEREHWNARRIYAVGGMDRLATLTGLTEGEAYSVVDALRGLTRLARVEAENKRMREALEFYARADTWTYGEDMDGNTWAYEDGGAKARAALARGGAK